VPRGAKSRMRRTETPEPIWIKFCMVVDIPDVVTHTNFGDHRLRGFWVAGGSNFPLSHWLSSSPLQHSHYHASVWSVDDLWNTDEHLWNIDKTRRNLMELTSELFAAMEFIAHSHCTGHAVSNAWRHVTSHDLSSIVTARCCGVTHENSGTCRLL